MKNAPIKSLPALTLPLFLAGLLTINRSTSAQTLSQSFTLQKGWNAIYLEVSPPDGNPATLFAGLPVASVWTRRDRLSSVDFIQDVTEAEFNQADWLKWYPPPKPDYVSDLVELQGRRAYLVNLTNGPVSWQVTGHPGVRSIQWVANAWNLRGFPVASNNPPTFRSFFQPSSSHYDSTQAKLRGVYRLGNDGRWGPANPDDRMRAGEACWVYCQGASSYTAPLEVSLDTGTGLEFGQELDRIKVQFSNLASGAHTVTLNQSAPFTAGVLAYQRFNPTNGFEWTDLPNPFTITVTNGSPTTLSLAIRRSLMSGTNYTSTLHVSDGQGTHYSIPVAAARSGLGYAGLWLGSVTVNAVSEPHFGSLVTNLYALVDDAATPLNDPRLIVTTNWVFETNAILVVQTTNGLQVPVYEKVERSPAVQSPTPTGSEFTMRLMIHVDAAGQARLLKEITQMWRDGTYTNDAQGYQVVDKPGTYVLVTRDDLLSQFKGSVIRDGVSVGRRLSAIGFDFNGQGTNHMALSGTFGPGHSLTGQIRIAPDYPLNPFRHKYHPDHDNLDAEYEPITDPAKTEVYAVTRQLRFEFASSAGTSAATPDPAYSIVEGVYRETLTGLHKKDLLVQGTFRLTRASFIAELNPSPTP